MISARKIARNTGVYFAANILYYLLSFFTVMYTARYLGANGYGILSIALAFASTFAIIADLGIGTLTTREIAKNRGLTPKFVGNTLIIKLILAFISVIMVFFIANLANYSSETVIAICIVSLSIIFGVFPGIFSSIFQAYEKMEFPSLNIIMGGFFTFFGTLILILVGAGVIEFAILNVVVGVIALCFSLIIYSWKFSKLKIEFDSDFCKKILKESLPFGLIGISGMLYTYLDSILLSLFQPIEVVGWYNAAYRLILVLLFIPTAINAAVFPVMSKYFVSSPESLKLINERYFKYMIIIGVPIGFGTSILAYHIISLIFGSSYAYSTIALQILIWTMVFTFAGASFVQIFQATNHQIVITKISVICVIINLILNLLLISQFSYVGASIATVITEIILVTYLIKVGYKLGYGIRRGVALNTVVKVILCSIVMSIFLWYFQNLNLFILILFAMLLYMGLLYLLRGIDDIDWEIISRIIKEN